MTLIDFHSLVTSRNNKQHRTYFKSLGKPLSNTQIQNNNEFSLGDFSFYAHNNDNIPYQLVGFQYRLVLDACV